MEKDFAVMSGTRLGFEKKSMLTHVINQVPLNMNIILSDESAASQTILCSSGHHSQCLQVQFAGLVTFFISCCWLDHMLDRALSALRTVHCQTLTLLVSFAQVRTPHLSHPSSLACKLVRNSPLPQYSQYPFIQFHSQASVCRCDTCKHSPHRHRTTDNRNAERNQSIARPIQ